MSNILEACADMEPESHPTEKNINLVMKMLKQGCFDFVVAGGYARDAFYGEPAKDCDICIFNFHPNDPAEQVLLQNLMEVLSNLTGVRMCEAYDEDDKRLGNVIKLDAWGIDIIFYASAKSAREVVAQFDCNMNQFYFANSVPDFDNPILPEPSLTGLVHLSGDAPTKLVFLADGDLTTERIIKMGQKWYAYTGLEMESTSYALYESALFAADEAMKADIPW